MRRTARVLYATALAGAALGAAASGAAADPAAEVSPGSVEPGGTVTVTVSCDAIGGTLPDFIDASSQGFQEGKVQLHRVTGAASYSGTAHIASGEPDPAAGSATEGAGTGRGFDEVSPGTNSSGAAANSDAKNSADAPAGGPPAAVSPAPGGWAAVVPDAQAPAPGAGDPVVPDSLIPDTDSPDAVGPDVVGPDQGGPDSVGPDTVGPDSVAPDDLGPDTVGPDTVPEPLSPDTLGSGTAAPGTVEPDIAGPDTGGADGRWNVGGVCPAPPGGHGKQWTASYSVARGATATHVPDSGTGSDTGAGERPPTIQRGVHAGEGGVFTDSVPALVAGGLLIAGALGAAAQRVHRLRRRRR